MVGDESQDASVKTVLAVEIHDPMLAAFIRQQP